MSFSFNSHVSSLTLFAVFMFPRDFIFLNIICWFNIYGHLVNWKLFIAKWAIVSFSE